MKTFWMTVAAASVVAAAVFVFRRDFDTAFVIAAIGAVAWFLNYRVRMKQLVTSEDNLRYTDEDIDSDDQD